MQKIEQKTQTRGWVNGFIGMLIFSGSLPATKAAVLGFDPLFLTAARATIAGLLSLIMLLLYKEKLPTFKQWVSLTVVSLGVVVGFPLLTAIALQEITSAHSLVFLALLPLSTAIFAVIRGGEKPRPIFWFFSIIGSLLVMGYALSQGGGSSISADLLMIASVIVCGLGYAEGATLTKALGGWQVICWALIVSLPPMIILSFILMPEELATISLSAWLGLGYVSLFSMLIGFIFWYKGLSQGGIATVGQLQLLQPFFGLGLAAVLLHESVNLLMLFVTIGVIFCVAGSRKYA
ncbi:MULTISPECIES: DMT family transporter [Enterobacterales]|uniref:DMT family transporter n=1 Tax=Enterobacterales TaxID=91347 RepID=UPI000848182C|nr:MULTISPECIES: DMT family transporter [Enterobacterales]ODQ07959.1 transporter [Shigella sp. FC130]OEI95423.1 transporter [Shigella sp. FC1655]WOO51592.1 DMT family transporter [Hafnia alvei]WPF06064.1 DMT family transporter [Proteus vulgaris]